MWIPCFGFVRAPPVRNNTQAAVLQLSMRSLAAVTLLAFVECVLGKEQSVNHPNDAENSFQKVVDNFADKLVDKMFDLELSMSALHPTNMDHTMLAKPRNLPASHHLSTSTTLCPRPGPLQLRTWSAARSSKTVQPSGAISPSKACKLIDGLAIAANIRKELKVEISRVKSQRGLTPGLAVVMVGSRPDSTTYVRMKSKACEEVGIFVIDRKFDENVGEDQVTSCIQELNSDSRVHGILVQLPLPKHIDQSKVLSTIAFHKDVDGFSAQNMGELALNGKPSAVACTPKGCMELLRRTGVDPSGKDCVVLGRSNIVGMPMALLLIHANGSVKVCHSETPDIANECRRADIVVQ